MSTIGPAISLEIGLPPTRGLYGDSARALLRSRPAMLGLTLSVLTVLLAFFAPLLAPYDPLALQVRDRLMAPGPAHWLGTDEIGRDLLSRVLYGAQTSLLVGLGAMSMGLCVGVPLGIFAAYYGGAVEGIIMRLMDGLLAFPAIVLAMAILAVLGPGLGNAMLAIGVVQIPTFARLARSCALATQELDFVLAGRTLGAGDRYLMFRVILPNALSPLLVQVSLSFASAVLTEAALSFLGLGVRPPTPSWGAMLDVGRRYLAQAPWYSLVPGMAIFVTVLGLNLLGDGLRDALDPRLRRQR